MALKYSATARTNRATQLNTDIEAGAILRLYSGTRPANVATAITGALVASLTCNATAFGTVANGILTANAITSAVAGAGGTVTHFRLFKSDGTTAVIDGDVAASGADLNLDNPVVATGQTIQINSWVLTMAGA